MRLFQIASFLGLLAVFSSVQAEQLPIEVLSAVIKDQKIPGAEVLLQRNGAQSVVGHTDAQGRVNLEVNFSDDASNLLIIKKPGYSNLVVKCPCKDMTYAISPVMTNLDGLRVVLTWGARPSDLDSHMVFPGANIYFGNRRGNDANLDVDDTSSFGPETITLEKKHYGESYVYSVRDYSNHSALRSLALSNSQAKVFVYMGQSLVRTYYVPQNREGNLWTVFRITKEGDFQDINNITGTSNPLNAMTRFLDDNVAVTALSISTTALNESKTLNQKGEAAYHAGDLNQAIEFYRQAIELNNGFGQAYSNLGLAYQKTGNTAESIWANRKAIALASGKSAATVRASSYYNIARIYEGAGQFSDALRHYQLAKQQKFNPVYDKAIDRVQNR